MGQDKKAGMSEMEQEFRNVRVGIGILEQEFWDVRVGIRILEWEFWNGNFGMLELEQEFQNLRVIGWEENGWNIGIGIYSRWDWMVGIQEFQVYGEGYGMWKLEYRNRNTLVRIG